MEGTIRWQTLVNWRTLLFLVVLLLSFNLFVFPARSRYMQAITHEQNPTIDTWGFYTPARVYAMSEKMGDTGRLFYALTEVSVDFVYPLVYTPLLVILLALLLPRTFVGVSRLVLGLWRLPLLVWLFDYLENGGIFNLLMSYPAQPAAAAWVTCGFTLVKTVALLACLGLVLVSLVRIGVRAIRGG